MSDTLLARLRAINIFASPKTAANEYEVENERISTRIFILALLIITIALIIYTAQVIVPKTIEVQYMSYEKFQLLSIQYPTSLRCPCQNVSIPQNTFINLEPRFHQICSSDFISKDWLNLMNSIGFHQVSNDFSFTGGLFFQTLQSFCRLANQTINNALKIFYHTDFIIAQALTESMFNVQIDALIQQFQSLTKLNYFQSFNLIEFSTATNNLLSGLFSNVELMINPTTNLYSFVTRLYRNNRCSCAVTAACVTPTILQDHSTKSSAVFTIPGLFSGCFLVSASRQSSLECLYSASCIMTIKQFLWNYTLPTNFPSPLNSSIQSQFNMITTIDELLSQAMTEKWKQHISHAQYFDKCSVSTCRYTITSRFNIAYIFATVIGPCWWTNQSSSSSHSSIGENHSTYIRPFAYYNSSSEWVTIECYLVYLPMLYIY